MGKDTLYDVVRIALVADMSAVVVGGVLWDSWVEDCMLKYVVVKKVPEAEWLRDGPSKLKSGGSELVWGRRLLAVVSRVGKRGAERVSVKVEVMS